LLSSTFGEKKDIPGFVQPYINGISEYFQNPLGYICQLELPLIGTPFQLKVWNALKLVRAGTVICYADFAKGINTSPRAVGQALRNNPFPILIPCHRVVAKQGIGGFMGQKSGECVSLKQKLLAVEGLEFPPKNVVQQRT
jgi:methylated-DNA-[protein]-cysteine S-methyltransferase